MRETGGVLALVGVGAEQPAGVTRRNRFRPGIVEISSLSVRCAHDQGIWPPEVILAASNVFDDVEHCMKANTSPHLAEQATGGREFVTGTLAGVLNSEVPVPDNQPVVFSPFGLGILDLAVGAFVHQQARAVGKALAVPDFFAETQRW